MVDIAGNPSIDASPLATGLGDLLNASPARLAELTTARVQQYGTSPLLTGIGDFLQQAPAEGLDLVNGPLAIGLGDYLQQATTGWPTFTNGTFSDDLGAFLQQAVQDGASFLASTFSTSVGDLLEQAAKDATPFADPTLSGELGSFLQEAAHAGTAYANSSDGAAAAAQLQQAAANSTDFLDTAFIGTLDSLLPSGGGGGSGGSTTEVAYVVTPAAGANVTVSAADGLLQNATGTGAHSVVPGTVTGAEGGTFVFNADGSFTYTPPANSPGFDYAKYTATDAQGDQGTATVYVLSQLPGENFVAGGVVWKFFEQVLHRDPAASDLAFFIPQLAAYSTGVLSADFFESDELLSQIITGFYQQYLSRAPQGNDLPFWEEKWRDYGGPELIIAQFASSQEFNALAGNPTGANPAGWITTLYDRILKRSPQGNDLPFWQQQLAGGTTEGQVALDFVASKEAFGDDVTGWFNEYLGRAPTPAEQAQYVNQMLTGGSDRDIEEAITNLPEYSANPPAAPPGSGVRLPDYFSANSQASQAAAVKAADALFSVLGS